MKHKIKQIVKVLLKDVQMALFPPLFFIFSATC